MRKIELGEQRVRLPETVVFEAVFVLEKQQSRPRRAIMSGLLPIIELPEVEFRGKPALRKAFDLYVRFSSLSFADAYHGQMALEGSGGEIVSFDRGFDRIPGIKRVEP
jgi:predicted nucleic acid-binding protein